MSWKSLGKKIPVILSAGLAIVSLQISEKEIVKNNSKDNSPEQMRGAIQEQRASLKLALQLPSLGFDNTVANATLIQFIQYFGDSEAREKTDYSASADFFEVILKNDPYHLAHYVFLSGSNTLYAGNPDRTVELIDNSLSELSPEQPSDGFYVWRYKAVDELLFLGDSSASQNSFNTAADWAEQSKSPNAEVVSEQSRQTAEFLATNPSSRIAQIDAWGSILTTALDDNTRAIVVQKIESLGGSISITEEGGISISYGHEETANSEEGKSSDT